LIIINPTPRYGAATPTPSYRHMAHIAIRQLSARVANSFLQLPFIDGNVIERMARQLPAGFAAAARRQQLYHEFQLLDNGTEIYGVWGMARQPTTGAAMLG
jgi:hypothetical protein